MKKLFLDMISLCISAFGSTVVLLISIFVVDALDLSSGLKSMITLIITVLSFFFIASAVIPFMRNEYLDN